MGIGDILGGAAALVTIIGGIVAATKAGRKWVKSIWLFKIIRKRTIGKRAKLSDEKYQLEKDKLDKEITPQEAELKEQAGLQGLRYSSPLARDLFKLNMDATKKKLEIRLALDKEIVFSGRKKISKKDVAFLFCRLKETACMEAQALKRKVEAIYKDCHADSLIEADKAKIDHEIDTLLEEKYKDLMIEKEQA